jgi:hypothetical protein
MASKRLFILGAGFSKASKMPLATELLDLLTQEAAKTYASDDDQTKWLNDLHALLQWLKKTDGTSVNIEEFFDYAAHEAEMRRMEQHRCPVGRCWGAGTPWNQARTITSVLNTFEELLVRVIFEKDLAADLEPVVRMVKYLKPGDGVVTFNYDTLVERSLTQCRLEWTHGLQDGVSSNKIVVLKMHGSIDWICFSRNSGNYSRFTKLFSKADKNASDDQQLSLNEIEYDFELWRANDQTALLTAIDGSQGLSDRTIMTGLGGLGSHKPLHRLPGSGWVWARAQGGIIDADEIYIIGFSLSPFDGMARLRIADGMMKRLNEDRPPARVYLLDPNADALATSFKSVFKVPMIFDTRRMENVDWDALLG